MTLNELIESLENMRDRVDGNGDIEVRLAMQPNYPMLGSPRNVCLDHSEDKDRILIACSGHEEYCHLRWDPWDTDEIFSEEMDED